MEIKAIEDQFYPIGHPDYRQLPFTQQLEIVRLYQFDNDRYNILMITKGFIDKKKNKIKKGKLGYIHSGLDFLDKQLARHPCTRISDRPIEVQQFYAGYVCNYDTRQGKYNQQVHNIRAKNIVNLRAINYPLMIVSPSSWRAMTYCLERCRNQPQDKTLRRALTIVALMGRLECEDSPDFDDLFEKSEQYTGLLSLAAINDLYPVAEDNDWHHIARLANASSELTVGPEVRYTMHTTPDRDGFGNRFYPLVPEEFFLRDRKPYHIRFWGLLR